MCVQFAAAQIDSIYRLLVWIVRDPSRLGIIPSEKEWRRFFVFSSEISSFSCFFTVHPWMIRQRRCWQRARRSLLEITGCPKSFYVLGTKGGIWPFVLSGLSGNFAIAFSQDSVDKSLMARGKNATFATPGTSLRHFVRSAITDTITFPLCPFQVRDAFFLPQVVSIH